MLTQVHNLVINPSTTCSPQPHGVYQITVDPYELCKGTRFHSGQAESFWEWSTILTRSYRFQPPWVCFALRLVLSSENDRDLTSMYPLHRAVDDVQFPCPFLQTPKSN